MTATPLYRGFASSDEIDAEYKPSLRVADAEALMRGYGERSAAARTRLAGRYGIPYGPTRDEKLDIFPADRPDAPVFVFIHGGYWRAFAASDHSFVALGPVALGITTVVVDYSLCPKVTIDEITRQCRAAVAWTLRHIGAHGGDPARVAVGGHSAGGHLSAMCLETRWDEDYGLARDPLAAALLVSGIYDIEPLRHSYLQPTIQLDDGIVRRNSPLFGVRPCATPVLVDLGWRRERRVRAPVDLVPCRLAGGGQSLRAVRPARRESLLGDRRLRRPGPSALPVARRSPSHIALKR